MCTVNGGSTDRDRITFSGNNVTCTNPEDESEGGCFGATIDGCDHVLCNGFEACDGAEVTGATTVRCDGNDACIGATINATARVDCDSMDACGGALIVAGTTVRCTGDSACQKAMINATATVDCDGKLACLSATITIDATGADDVSTPPVVTCNGVLSCRDANVNAGPSGIIVCSGDEACSGTSATGACVQCRLSGACSSSCTWSPDSTTDAVDCPTEAGTLGTCPSSMPSMAPS
eukprot:scaffold25771_cov35-Attheya_sp.AAC.1